MELSGRIPQAGERFVVGGLEVDVLGGTAVRLERLLVRRPAGPPQELGGGR
jgi:CBS domain containing-hemolysin-like protein